MKGFVGVKDNDWCACVTLLKYDWPKVQALRHKATKSDWAKPRMDERNKGASLRLTSSDIP